MIQNKILQWTYKTLAILILTYVILFGLLKTLPQVGDLAQTARNLFFHVPMWFTMYLMMFISVIHSLRYLKRMRPLDDIQAEEAAGVGVFFGLLGLFTGMVWSRVTWGALMQDTNPAAWWSWDPKQTGALVAILIYGAYFILRGSIEEPDKKARLAAVYNIFAAASLIPLTLIIPRFTQSLHPGGTEGSPVFNTKDVSNEYRLVFYPAIIGFMLLAIWVYELRVRLRKLESKEIVY